MTIKELISKLQNALDESGDVEVNVMTLEGEEFEVKDVSLDGWITIN